MRLLEGELILSPSDLTGYAACEHLTQLELLAARGVCERPTREDPLLDVLSARGTEHEDRVLDELRATRSVVEIENESATLADLERSAADTIAAMRDGADVIYQAAFFDGRWVGYADFLLRVDDPTSNLGGYSYEVADAKLARRVKAAALLQMCCYSEHVERIQGRAPERIHVATGAGAWETFRLTDYSAYYRALKSRFEGVALGGAHERGPAPAATTYPNPVDHCGICRWAGACADRRRADDHLSLVAGMRSDQTRKLVVAGIPTTTALAHTPAGSSVDGIGDATFERLRHQAELQVAGAGCVPPRHELLRAEPADGERPARGLAALPAPSPGDLFFDMEGDPYALDGGLEYLFGVVEEVDGVSRYQGFWAHDRAEERVAFEQFVDLVEAHRREHPGMHIYHYAHYEPSTIRRLMGAHGTCETEVDEWLRAELFVDLFAVVRQGVRLSTESYSLKQVEKLYMQRPAGEVMDAGSSIVAYEHYLETHDPSVLAGIEAYNADDCVSTWKLREWLEARRVDLEARDGAFARPVPSDGEASEELTAREEAAAELAAEVVAAVPDDPAARSPDDNARWLLAHLLHWHRREQKPEWWAYYHRLNDLSGDDFVDDPDCIGHLTFDCEVGPVKQSVVRRYTYPPQDSKIRLDTRPIDPATGEPAGLVVAVDDSVGVFELSTSAKSDVQHPHDLIPPGPIPDYVLRDALMEVAGWVVAHGIDDPSPTFRAARDLLLHRPPRAQGQEPIAPLVAAGESPLDAARRLVGRLDATCLAIQGPPGSGKTYTGTQMILELLGSPGERRRVGIVAHTHAAIGNLLDELCDHAAEAGVDFKAIQKSNDEQRCATAHVETTDDAKDVEARLDEFDVVAGTPWLWARPNMRDSVDVLFVDEAGQMSLANVVACSTAARSIVLLGDPQQLAQPSKGAHPEGADVSALAHLLGDDATIPEPLGLFLDTTHRMHPAVCRFISDVAYDGRLLPERGLELQSIEPVGVDGLGGAGLRFVPVEHTGNRTASPEEAMVVAQIVDALVGRTWVDRFGDKSKLTVADVLVVAPYNAQVARIRQCVSAGVRVGTVDKFQGQEAPVAIYSMATSSADDVPRGMEFLYDLHRLNVAVSRARGEAIVVCSPELLRVLCRSPKQMRLANALCMFDEYAEPGA